MTTITLISSENPCGSKDAIVESDERCVYLYVRNSSGEILSCWIRNLLPAPAELDVSSIEQGKPPLLPAQYCRHPDGLPIDRNKLRIVWLEEENGAAVIEDGQILAVCPAWANGNPCPGFARDCLKENPVAWPLGAADENALHERVQLADAYWQEWDLSPSPWDRLQQEELSTYEVAFGSTQSRYFAIDGGKWPPKAIAQYDLQTAVVLVTVGVALRPQPGAEYLENPSGVRRIELGIAVSPSVSSKDLQQLARYLSGQTELPWASQTWIGGGHTIPCDSWPATKQSIRLRWTTENTALGLSSVKMPNFRGDDIQLLWGAPESTPPQRKSWISSIFGRK